MKEKNMRMYTQSEIPNIQNGCEKGNFSSETEIILFS